MKKLNNNSLHTSSALGLLWQIIKGVLGKYFNIMPDKENEQETIRSISEGVSFRGASGNRKDQPCPEVHGRRSAERRNGNADSRKHRLRRQDGSTACILHHPDEL